MPVIDQDKLPVKTSTIYPAPYDAEMGGRRSVRLGDTVGLTQFGANLTILEPNAKSSLRHWHHNQDEFVVVTQGTVTLVDDNGETEMTVGQCAGFPAGDTNGHQFINKSTTQACFVVIGTRTPTETAVYSDIDMKLDITDGKFEFTHKDGSPL